jgi:Fe2+ transport system protein B
MLWVWVYRPRHYGGATMEHEKDRRLTIMLVPFMS